MEIFDGKNKNTVNMEPGKLNVEGQTSGEWLKIGTYKFQAGKQDYVRLSTIQASDKAQADAILLVPER